LVVVVRDGFPTWAVVFAILVLLVAVAVLVFVITGGRGTVLVVAIPGFPVESILIGLVVGLLWVTLKRRSAKFGQRIWVFNDYSVSASISCNLQKQGRDSTHLSTRWK